MSDTVSKDRAVFTLEGVTNQRDPWPFLYALKSGRPGFKATVFMTPGTISDEVLKKYLDADWIEVGVNGYHGASYECALWTKEEAERKVDEVEEKWPGNKIWKCPNWATNEDVERHLAWKNWVSVTDGAYVLTWGRTEPKRYIYNCAMATSIHGNAGNSRWADVIQDLPMDQRWVFASEEAKKWDIDLLQETENSWSHQSAYGKNAAVLLRLAVEKLKPKGRVADFGGNDGYAAHMCSYDNITVVDQSIPRVAFAKAQFGLNAVRTFLEDMPFEDDEFEWGFSSHTLEHVFNLDKAMDEIKRVCKKGCWITVPNDSGKKKASHFHSRDEEGWKEYLEQWGSVESNVGIDVRRAQFNYVVRW
jgi:SAM-dependent methyltransferase